MIKKINIHLLGSFSVHVDGRCVTSAQQKLTKPWQLFCYLVMKDGKAATSDELLDAIWGDEDLTDAANVLKNTVYALRKDMSGAAKPQESPVVFRGGGYATNLRIKYITDANVFASLCAKANMSKADDPLDLYREAVAAYSGDVLSHLTGEPWAILWARSYRCIYVSAAHSLCALLEQAGEWEELQRVASRLNQIEPFDEEGYLFTFRALSHMNLNSAIVTTYSKTERFFKEQLGLPISDEIRRIEREAANVNEIERDLMIITDDLRDAQYEDSPASGALVYSYDAFIRASLLMARSSTRSNSHLSLLLFTVRANDAATPIELAQAMNDLKNLITTRLRKSDVCCRYSRRQYAALLITDSKSSAEIASLRIVSGFGITQYATLLELDCKCKLLSTQSEEINGYNN